MTIAGERELLAAMQTVRRGVDQVEKDRDRATVSIGSTSDRLAILERVVATAASSPRSAAALDAFAQGPRVNTPSAGADPIPTAATEGWAGLLSPRELALIEERCRLPDYGWSSWDRWDFSIVGGAGLLAALYDIFAVAIPRDMVYLGKHVQESGITPLLKRLTDVPNDNPLARWFRVPYDNQSVPGMNPRTHRLQSLGHDPVIGLFVGVRDILRGQMTAFDKGGSLHVVEGLGEGVEGLHRAIIIQLGHLLSDAFTKMGLPFPGAGLLQGFRVGAFGKRDRTIGDIVRWMYLNGFDLRHFAVQMGSPAIIEVVVRGALMLREYAEQIDDIADPLLSARTQAKLQSMLTCAHAIAAAANAGKVYMLAGNPLAINYAQWAALWGRLLLLAKDATFTSEAHHLDLLTRRTIAGWADFPEVELLPAFDSGRLADERD